VVRFAPSLHLANHRLPLTRNGSIPHPSSSPWVLLSFAASGAGWPQQIQRPKPRPQLRPAAGAELATGVDTCGKLVAKRRQGFRKIAAALSFGQLGQAASRRVANFSWGWPGTGTSQAPLSPGASGHRSSLGACLVGKDADHPQPGMGPPRIGAPADQFPLQGHGGRNV